MPHGRKALVINCMDFRLQAPLVEWAEKMGLGGRYDLLSVAGSAKDLAGHIHREFLLKSVGVAVDLHKADEIHILHHEDCGAYGGKAAFASDEEESAVHRRDMEAARETILGRYPAVKVKLHYFKLTDSGPLATGLSAE